LGTLVVLGAIMIWLGYAGFSGAIVTSLAILATIVGVSTEAVLSLVAWSAGTLFGAGALIHLVIFGLKRGAKSVVGSVKAEPVAPAFLRPSAGPLTTSAVAMAPSPSKAKALAAPLKGRPGAVELLFPQRA
jgi:hypothetical protein